MGSGVGLAVEAGADFMVVEGDFMAARLRWVDRMLGLHRVGLGVMRGVRGFRVTGRIITGVGVCRIGAVGLRVRDRRFMSVGADMGIGMGGVGIGVTGLGMGSLGR